jgi:tetratricopeptide (TPR) repeat protein
MSNTSLQRAYTVAIALNNMGVSLLERGSYDQAMETFQDAISVMTEITASSTEQEMPRKRPLGFSTLDAKLRKATYNLANCDTAKHDSKMNFCVLTGDESPAVVAAALQNENMFFDSSTTFLIRIEKSIHDCLISAVDFDVSLILHNFGNAYNCLATTATTAACAKELCEGALKMFEVSYALFQNSKEESLPVAIIILRSLAAFASTLGMGREAEAYYAYMLELTDSFFAMDYLLTESTEISAAAAA